jgi:hypothetical protein
MALVLPDDGPGARWRPDLFDRMTVWFGERSEVTQMVMFGVPAFYVGGRVFVCVWGDGVGLRLPTEVAQSVVGLTGLRSFTPLGRTPMRGWIQRDCTDEPQFTSTLALSDAAYEYVRTL